MKRIIFLPFGIAALLLAGCGKPAAPSQGAAPPAAPVTVVQPQTREIMDWDEYQGHLEAVSNVELRARVSGYLQSIHFQDGAPVKRGDLLFVIDPRPYQAEFDRAQAELLQAQTRFELASNDVQRADKLLAVKAISVEEADSRAKAEREAAAAIQSGRAMVEMAQLNLDYTRITAPIDGRIGRKMITEGNLVNGDQGQSTLLATIVSLDPIYCYFDADERSVLKYEQLGRAQNGERFGGGTKCQIQLDDEATFSRDGKLDFMDNRVDPATGTLRVRGVLSNSDHLLQPGFFVRVRVPGSAPYPGLMIPEDAIGTDQGRKFVYTVDAENVPHYTPIQLGPLFDGQRAVRQGLHSNDWIIANGLGLMIMPSLPPGAKVNPVHANNPGAATH